MGNMSLAILLAIPPQVSTAMEGPTPVISHPTTLAVPAPSSGVKWWHHSPDQAACLPWSGGEVVQTSEEPPHQKQKDRMSLKKLLKGVHQEAFAKDSNLVQQVREAYFRMNHPDLEVLHDLSGLFQEMITSVDLLDSEIYQIQEVWTGWGDLQYANDALKLLPKGLQFFCQVSPSESPKVMDPRGVHHPAALHHFAGLTFCPWCGKEGQNKGMVVNHLQTMHYKLGLVCSGCLHFPLITSEAIWPHSWGCKQPRESDTE